MKNDDVVAEFVKAEMPELWKELEPYKREAGLSDYTLGRLWSPTLLNPFSDNDLTFLYRYFIRATGGGMFNYGLESPDRYWLDVDLRRSAGYPANTTKDNFFSGETVPLMLSNPCHEIKPFQIKVCSKDGVLDIEKQGRVRSFYVPPASAHLAEYLHVRKMMDWQNDNWIRNDNVMGYGAKYGDIHAVMRRFDGLVTFATDVSGLEYTIHPDVQNVASMAEARCSTHPRCIRKLQKYFDEAELVTEDGRVFPPSSCNKSGRVVTLCRNGNFTAGLIRLYWKHFCEEHDIEAKLAVAVMGDDALFGFDPEFQALFCKRKFVGWFLKRGLLLDIEGGQIGAWGLSFCGSKCDGPNESYVSVRPAKIMSRLLYYGLDVDRKLEILAGIYQELWSLPKYRAALKQIAGYLVKLTRRPFWLPADLAMADMTGARPLNPLSGLRRECVRNLHFLSKQQELMPPKKKNRKKKNKNTTVMVVKSGRGKRVQKGRESVPLAQSVQYRSKFGMTMSTKGSNHAAKVHCMDLISLVPKAQSAITSMTTFHFTPSASNSVNVYHSAFLTRLRQIGGLFSRFRVRRARMHYQSLTSATVGGSVGMAISTGAQSEPSSVAALLAYGASAVGPHWQNLVTPAWENHEDRWFQANETKQPQAPPISLHIMNTNGTVDTINGIFWLEVDVDFIDLRSPQQESSSWLMDVAHTAIGNSAATTRIPWGRLNSQSGYWQWAADLAYMYLTSGSAVDLPAGSSFDIDGFQYVEWNADLLLAAAATSEEDWQRLQRKPVHRFEDDEKETNQLRKTIVPRTELGRMTRVEMMVEKQRFRDTASISAGDVLFYAASTAEGRPMGAGVRAPAAAGDVWLALSFQAARQTDVVNLYEVTYSPGTGAAELLAQWSGYIAEPGAMFLNVIPTGIESRQIGATSSMSIEVVTEATSSA